MATVDVLIPVYNTPPQYFDECIQSILVQTLQDFRIVIYDDGSDIPAKVPDDPRIVLVRNATNNGVAYARNRLFDLVKSPYACFQDADDISLPTRLEVQLASLAQVDMTRCFYALISANGERLPAERKHPAFASSFFVKDITRFRFVQHPKTLGEARLWFRQLDRAGIRRTVVRQTLYLYRMHEGNESWRKLSEHPSVRAGKSELTG